MKWGVVLTCALVCLACGLQTGKRLQALPSPPKQILVSSWPVPQPSTVLGEVHVDSFGILSPTDAILNTPRLRQLGKRPKEPNVNTEQLYELVRKRAYEQYGAACDAVLLVTYHADHNGTVSASGIAVQFVSAPPALRAATPLPANNEDRLEY